MKNFIEDIAFLIYNDFSSEFYDMEIIVPNNRTKKYLINEIQKKVEKTTYAPKITPISEMFYKNSDLNVPNDLFLIAKLYNVYKKYTKSNETLDDFFYWGQVLLNDFNDIDNYLINAENLFKNILDFAKIDVNFGEISEDEKKIIENFWKNININKENKSQEKQIFLSFCQNFYSIYKEFSETLISEKLAYQALLYRKVIENLDSCKFEKKIYFIIGFNALNKCEENLFKYLKIQKETFFFWDADIYYTENNFQEAGRFLSNLIKKFPSKFKIKNNILEKEKTIDVISAPSPIAQLKILKKIFNNINKNEKTAIVLADENLLIPLLYSLDIEDFSYNISMGYPLKISNTYTFLKYLLELQANINSNGNFYRKDVENINNHQFFTLFWENKFWSEFAPNQKITNIYDLVNYLKNIFNFISKKTNNDLEEICISIVLQQITALYNCTYENNIEISKEIFVKLLKNNLKVEKIPFEGENMDNVQILGFIETRNLDFDNVIMLSMNEDIFPQKNTIQSNIPYNIRRAFGLPIIEYQDSIFAYYYYRLLQNSKNVFILYSSQISDANSEQSRFVTQIKYELDKKNNKNSKTEIRYTNYGYQISKGINKIIVKKNEKILKQLNNINNENGFYPYNINTYLNCNLKYYLKFIVKLKETKTIEDDFNAATIGTLFHNTIEILYKNYIGKIINNSDFHEIKLNLNEALICAKENFLQEMKNKNQAISEIPDLLLEIVKKYISTLLDYDKKHSPFTLLGLEKEFNKQIYIDSKININLKGKIDRFDLKDGIFRVFDYKTGSVSPQKELENLFEQNQKYDYNALTQVLIYTYLVEKEQVVPGILKPHELNNENYDYRIKIEKEANCFKVLEQISNEQKNIIEEKLKNIFETLFNPNNDFEQTEQIENCKYCEFKILCERD